MGNCSPLNFDEIIEIEDAGLQDTYDFTIPKTHNYFANGILVHNCGDIEQDADIIILLHRPSLYDASDEPNITRLYVPKIRQIGKPDFVKLLWKGDLCKNVNIRD